MLLLHFLESVHCKPPYITEANAKSMEYHFDVVILISKMLPSPDKSA